jgi:hypothetical protein
MRFHQLSKFLLALLLMATLPLRAYAVPCKSPATQADPAPAAHAAPVGPAAPLAHAAHAAHAANTAHDITTAHFGTHCDHGSLGGHSAACDCCCMAVAAASSSWTLANDSPGAVLARLISLSPVLTLDRLDRPPRLSA